LKELNEKQKKNYKIIRIILQAVLLIAFIVLIAILTIKLYPYFTKIQNDEIYREEFTENIRSYGVFSFFLVLGAQILQTILAVIPSGPIVMISGMLFNPVLAVIVCLLGQTIGAILVFYLVKLLGYNFIALFIDPDKIKNSKFIANKNRTNVLMFGYLLIPALPKDIVSFVAPFTKIKIKEFILISFIARIPMTIVTVLMGNSIIDGSYILAIVLACVSALLALLCFIFNKKIVNYLENRNMKKTKQ
jgi:uncharacterized membrane protein YdjX (TVP38/TMEM64 family)